MIDKSKVDLWTEAERISSNGYVTIFDANGISTLSQSYEHLSQTGRLIVYGFHSNLPIGNDLLSPYAWGKMILGMLSMPKFDAMELTLKSRGILGFNLSFFADELELIQAYMNTLVEWLEQEKIVPSRVTVFPVNEIRKAHALIQSGKSIGKIVMQIEQQQ